MFDLISTKDLYLLEISQIIHTEFPEKGVCTRQVSNERRYTLGNKVSSDNFKDIFTHTIYVKANNVFDLGAEFATKYILL